jgi:hypothetical protein
MQGGLSVFQPNGKLAFGIDHEQPLRQLSWSARAREAQACEIERTGLERWVGRSSHARILP